MSMDTCSKDGKTCIGHQMSTIQVNSNLLNNVRLLFSILTNKLAHFTKIAKIILRKDLNYMHLGRHFKTFYAGN